MIACVFDSELLHACNAKAQNYWDVYLAEILNQLGGTGNKLSLQPLEDADALKAIRVLLIGSQSGAILSPAAKDQLRE